MLRQRGGAVIAFAMGDEIQVRPAEPGHRDLAARMEDCGKIVPACLVAGETPGLNELGAGGLV
jgi:hypothetical protein